MSTTLQSTPAPVEQRLVLYDVDWSTYERLLDDLEGQHLRINYDQGRLEIMTTSSEHERWKKLLARFFEVLTEELNLPILGVGNFTIRREDVNRGLEPDECWYIAHESSVRQTRQIDLNVDPPPDLVVEIEVSRSVLNRLEMFAALGVPEIWRFDGTRLSVLVLGPDGRYGESDHSPTFPAIPLSGFAGHLDRRGQTDETTLVKSFRKWVRQITAG
jgi:Uma2 family endonuclease